MRAFGPARHESCLIGQCHLRKCANGIFRIQSGLQMES